MSMKVINLENVFIKTEKNDRSLKSILEKTVNHYYKDNKITLDEYESMGGTKISSQNTSIQVFSDPNFVYEYPIICNSCKKKYNSKLTPNLPGITCFISKTSKTSPLNIKVKCRNCNMNKNSYINKKNLPEKILKIIDAKLKEKDF